MMKYILLGIVAVCSVEAAVPKFEKGDRVAFVGDSITHGGSYHPNVYLFYATRFPSAPFKVYNCGISGDTAPGTNIRFEEDIAIHKPNRATIMLGMNDAWAWLFAEPDNPGHDEGMKNCFDLYTKEMDQLAASLKELGTEITFIKPSIYDQTAELKTKNLVGKNDMLGEFAVYLDELAAKYDGSIIDFYTPMMAVNARLQEKDPTATLVGLDRVHPGAEGHFVMSYAFLKAQEMPALVSSIKIDAADATAIDVKNASIETSDISTNQVSFTCLEQALPFPVAGNQKAALEWVPFQEELNQQILSVENLKAGIYDLAIDGQVVGTYSSVALAQGINLSSNEKTPQFQQALKVKAVNDERLQVVDKIRAIMHVRHTMIRKLDPPVDGSDMEALRTALKDYVEKSRGQSWHGYIGTQAEKYLEHVEHEAEYYAEAEQLMDTMWQVNQPVAHQWELIPKL